MRTLQLRIRFRSNQVAEGISRRAPIMTSSASKYLKPVLERAFADTYRIDLSSIFVSVDLAIGSYRHAVSTVIPRTTRVAWHMKRHEIQNSPTPMRSRANSSITFRILNTAKIGENSMKNHRAGIKAFFLRLVPKVGPFSALL